MLIDTFDENQIEIYGVPVDETEGVDALEAYVEKNQPAYTLLTRLTTEQIQEVQRLGFDAVDKEILPMTIVTAGDGRILQIDVGVPNVSEVGQWVASVQDRE